VHLFGLIAMCARRYCEAESPIKLEARVVRTLALAGASSCRTARTRPSCSSCRRRSGRFLLPNFYFHATTAYDILRHAGVPLGKRHFLGRIAA